MLPRRVQNGSWIRTSPYFRVPCSGALCPYQEWENDMLHASGPAGIGQWYRRFDTGDMFLVTGMDERAGTIEVQTSDGDLDEFDADTWQALPLEPAPPPEDWTPEVWQEE